MQIEEIIDKCRENKCWGCRQESTFGAGGGAAALGGGRQGAQVRQFGRGRRNGVGVRQDWIYPLPLMLVFGQDAQGTGYSPWFSPTLLLLLLLSVPGTAQRHPPVPEPVFLRTVLRFRSHWLGVVALRFTDSSLNTSGKYFVCVLDYVHP